MLPVNVFVKGIFKCCTLLLLQFTFSSSLCQIRDTVFSGKKISDWPNKISFWKIIWRTAPSLEAWNTVVHLHLGARRYLNQIRYWKLVFSCKFLSLSCETQRLPKPKISEKTTAVKTKIDYLLLATSTNNFSLWRNCGFKIIVDFKTRLKIFLLREHDQN